MTSRRTFIRILPIGGAALLAACSEKSAAPPPPAPAAANPAPAPAPAPAEAPAPAPAQTPVVPAAAAPTAATAAGGPVTEADPTAVSLGYVSDSSRADGAKFKNHVAGQACGNCALFAGKPGDAGGPCPIFGGRQVSAKGWCSAYVKKA